MEQVKIVEGAELLHLMENRVKHLVGARLQNRGRIKKASESIDRLRRKCSGPTGAEEIRKWREGR